MIESVNNPRVKQVIAWSQRSKARREDRVFVAEGVKMFMEAPKEWLKEVFVSAHTYQKIQKEPELSPVFKKLEKASYEIVTDEVFKKMSDTQTPQGILCVVKWPEHDLKKLLEQEKAPLFVILETIQDPGNLGTILRTGEGAGITAVIMSRDTADMYNPKTIRSTMGSIYRVPFVYVEDLAETADLLKKHNIRLYAAHLKGEKNYEKAQYQQGTAFLIGNEGNGLREETAELADEYIRIPMAGKLESLNAAIAAALLMYEAGRQRR